MSAGSDQPEGEPVKTKRKNVKMLVIAASALALVVIACGLYLSGAVPKKKHKSAAAPTMAMSAPKQPVFVETPEMITNLDAGPHRVSFVKVQCKVELAQSADLSLMNSSMPRLVDLIQTYLRETRPEELRSDTGTYRLREALLSRAAVVAPNVEVKDVLFEELIVQ